MTIAWGSPRWVPLPPVEKKVSTPPVRAGESWEQNRIVMEGIQDP